MPALYPLNGCKLADCTECSNCESAWPLCSAYRLSLAASRPPAPAHGAGDDDDAEQVVRRLLLCHPALACPYPGLALAQAPAQSCAWKRRKQLLPQRSPLS